MLLFRTYPLLALLTLLILSSCEREDVVELADGGKVPFEHWDGRWLIINYWAEWCAPCRKEIPELNLMHSERASTGAVVLGVNYDALTGESLTSLIDEMGIEFPVLVADPRERWAVEQPPVLPSTIIVKPTGELSEVLVGPQHYEDLIKAIGAQPGGVAGE